MTGFNFIITTIVKIKEEKKLLIGKPELRFIPAVNLAKVVIFGMFELFRFVNITFHRV